MNLAKWEKLMSTAACSTSSSKQTNVAEKRNVKFERQTIASKKESQRQHREGRASSSWGLLFKKTLTE